MKVRFPRLRTLRPHAGGICLGVALGATWASFSLLWLVGVLVAVPAFLYMVLRARRLAAVALLASPFVVVPALSFALGVTNYLAGTAELKTAGEASPELANLHPRYRVYRSTSGYSVDGSELFRDVPNNLAVRGLVDLLGPMQGAYTGPYPSRYDSMRAIDQHGQNIPLGQIWSGKVSIAGRTIDLDPTAFEQLVTLEEPVKGVLYEDRVLMLSHANDAGSRVVLIDVESGEVFATYHHSRVA